MESSRDPVDFLKLIGREGVKNLEDYLEGLIKESHVLLEESDIPQVPKIQGRVQAYKIIQRDCRKLLTK